MRSIAPRGSVMGKSPEKWLNKMENEPRNLEPRHLQCVQGTSIRIRSALWDAPHRELQRTVPARNEIERNRKDALQRDGGRTDEEAALRPPSHEEGLGLGSRSAQEHKDYRNRGHRRGRNRVHYVTQLAVISVGLVGVHVRNLRYGQKRQQDQAHGRYYRQKAGATALSEPLGPES